MMMDSVEEAAQLCTTYGFQVGQDNGAAAVLLVKVSHGKWQIIVAREAVAKDSACAVCFPSHLYPT